MAPTDPRIVSLIPSATEIVFALGLGDYLVGRSHACDYPPQVQRLPICTAPNLDPQGSSQEIHDRVTALLQKALSIYRLDLDLLKQLQPTHILTQAQCEVCAVSLADVEAAIATWVDQSLQVISLQPHVLEDLWTDMHQVAGTMGVEGAPVVAQCQARLAACHQKVQAAPVRPRVACLEWTDPLMAAGNWVPQLVELAGGENVCGKGGEHSPWMSWEALEDADPDLIVLMPCGFNLAQTRTTAVELAQHSRWAQLRAVQHQQVYLTDGNQYFNRPGPRLVDSAEVLAEIFHPEYTDFGYEGQGWQWFKD